MKSNYILYIALGFLALTCWFSFDMSRLSYQELLWGYRPLFLFLSAWGAISFIFLWIRQQFLKKSISWKRLGLCTLSAVLLSLGFPDLIPAPFLMFVGFIPLLLVEQQIAADKESTDKWSIFGYGYFTFILWNILTTYWVTNSALVAGLFANSANALLMCIPLILFHQTKKIIPKFGYISFIVYWMCFDYMHLNWDLSWPWLTIGNSFAEFPSWVQWYEYTGVFGGSLWVLGLNVLLLKLYEKYKTESVWDNRQIATILGLVIVPIVVSMVMYHTYEENQEKVVNVAIIQPNYEPHYEKFTIPEQAQLNRFLELSESVVDSSTDYLLFPETSFGYVEVSRINNYPSIQRLRQFLKDHPDTKLISGVNAYYEFKPGEPHSDAVRERRGRNGEPSYYEIYNAAIQILDGNPNIPVYKKSKLVPGPEIFPFKKLFFFMEPLVRRLDGTTAGVATQLQRSVLVSNSGRIAPAICYESVFGEYSTGYIKKGAQAIFIMTNDGWWDNTAGHRQHLHFASLRAIETRRSIARAANTGISAFINQRGDILQPTQYEEAIAIKGSIALNDEITFYTRWGDLIARLGLFLAILLFLNTIVQGVMRKRT